MYETQDFKGRAIVQAYTKPNEQASDTCNRSNSVTGVFSQKKMAWVIEDPHC